MSLLLYFFLKIRNILELLLDGRKPLEITIHTFNLEKSGFIKTVHQIDRTHNIYVIPSKLFVEVRKFFEKRRNSYLDQFFSNMSDDEREFLQLFFVKKQPYGNLESGENMESNIYGAGLNLIEKDILIKIKEQQHDGSNEQFQLKTDVINHLENIFKFLQFFG